ncbi:lysylphosphatidylglycerol synthase transmembrane domain-containing protein [Pleomorphovibrio marinus]|uniref:lysylphosphatidylglycerol synthase transmembrane domain-containing protein n=1 Tax=Pleomorphovibrio marinus TaxID=2164132 RepID=UPI000E0A550B|nr:lysylphosphatidylglycerol synthase transmembrane domain-containing protein [Pleomorphovibrio marinus]
MKGISKTILQVIVPLALALGLFWYLYKDLSISQLYDALRKTSFLWVALSIAVSILGYYIRAWRWKLLINTEEEGKVSILPVFWGLMFGYLVNLLLPRAGELARCGAVNRISKVPVGKLLGTVVLERTVDMLFMLLAVLLALYLEKGTFFSILAKLGALESLSEKVVNFMPFFFIIVLLLFVIGFLLSRLLAQSQIVNKARQFVTQFVAGLKSVGLISNVWGFWVASVSIWIIYYLMMYWLALAMPVTEMLTPTAVLMVMVMGSIGMVAPVQGGIGTFHALVAFILVFYGLDEEEGKIFAVVVHGSQVLTILVFGIVSVLALWKLDKSPKLKRE